MADTPEAGSAATETNIDDGALREIATNGALLNQVVSELTESLSTFSDIVLPVANGGTGLDSVSTGDILYGSATDVYSLLPDVATGNALISGGVSTAPLWGKIGLTTHVSGTLPIANGGTNKTSFTAYTLVVGGTTSTGALQQVGAGTSGQILFSNGSSALPSFASLTDGIGGLVLYPDEINYRIWLNSPFDLTITKTSTRCTAGTCTLSFLVAAVSIGGTANSVSTTLDEQAHSYSVSAGQTISMTVSSNSGCEGMAFMVAYTRP